MVFVVAAEVAAVEKIVVTVVVTMDRVSMVVAHDGEGENGGGDGC